MRYYDIQMGSYHFTTDGPNPAALLVELDIITLDNDVPGSGSFVRVWGPDLSVIANVRSLFNQPISVKGGMSGGLPLEKPQQKGILASGLIFQAFGQYVGMERYVHAILTAGGNAPQSGQNPMEKPKNIVMYAKKDQDMGQAVQKALQQAFPSMSVNLKADQYKVKQDQLHISENLEQFANYVRRWSQQVKGGNNPIGLGIHLFDNKFTIHDDSQTDGNITIDLNDLVGQPTWVAPNEMQIRLVMRSDIKINQTINLPKTLIGGSQTGTNITPGSQTGGLTYGGTLTTKSIRHVGNSRQPDGASWVTIVNAYISGS